MKEPDSDQYPTARWGLLAVLYSLPVVIVFACFGEFGRGMTAGICTGIILGIVKTFWSLRKHLWFWITIAIFAVLHVPFVIFFPIPMSRNFTIWSLLPAMILDYVIMNLCIKRVEKAMTKRDGVSTRN